MRRERPDAPLPTCPAHSYHCHLIDYSRWLSASGREAQGEMHCKICRHDWLLAWCLDTKAFVWEPKENCHGTSASSRAEGL